VAVPPAPPPRGSRITQSTAVVSIPCADGTILIDGNGGRRITLDSFGSRVWGLLAGQPTLPVLLDQLRDDETRSVQLAEDVARLLMRWREMGVIAWR
jgi:hypothetical protein